MSDEYNQPATNNLSPDELRLAKELGVDIDDVEDQDAASLHEAAKMLLEFLETSVATGTPQVQQRILQSYQCQRCGAQACQRAGWKFACQRDLGGCGRTDEYDIATRRDANDVLLEVLVHPRILQRLQHEMLKSTDPDKAFFETLHPGNSSTKPNDLTEEIRRQLHKYIGQDGVDALYAPLKGYSCEKCAQPTLYRLTGRLWRCYECKKDMRPPNWVLRKDGSSVIVGAEFERSFLAEFSNKWRTTAGSETEAFQELTRDYGVPHEVRNDLEAALAKFQKQEDIIPLDDSSSIIIGRDYISIRDYNAKREPVEKIMKQPVQLHAQIELEEEIRFAGRDLRGEFVLNLPELAQRLYEQGQVFNQMKAGRVLAVMIDRLDAPAKGWSAFGIYDEDGELVMPERCYARTDLQRELWKRIQEIMTVRPRPQDWEALAALSKFFRPDEFLTNLAVGVMAPFAPVLRTRHMIMPGVYNWSRRPGSGKSKMSELISEVFWHAPSLQAPSVLKKDFRTNSVMDQGAVPQHLGEAQDIDWNLRGPEFKFNFESYNLVPSGVGDVTKTFQFRSRATIILTANGPLARHASEMARFFVVHFYEGRKNIPPEVQREFKRVYAKIPAIGPALAQAAIDYCQGKTSVLISKIRDEIQPELEQRYNGWFDSRRAEVWSIAYLGLKIVEHASEGKIPAPDYSSFVRDVIIPVDEATVEAQVNPLVRLQEYFEVYRSKGLMQLRESIKGSDGYHHDEVRLVHPQQNVTFMPMTWDKYNLRGHYITQAILDEFNKSLVRDVESKIWNLKDLAQMVSDFARIPIDELTRPDRGGVQVKFPASDGKKVAKWVCFLPEPEARDAEPVPGGLKAFQINGGAGNGQLHRELVTPTPVMAQADRIRAIVNAMREISVETTDGAEPKDIAVRAGVDVAQVVQDLDQLCRNGGAYQPRQGRFLPV